MDYPRHPPPPPPAHPPPPSFHHHHQQQQHQQQQQTMKNSPLPSPPVPHNNQHPQLQQQHMAPHLQRMQDLDRLKPFTSRLGFKLFMSELLGTFVFVYLGQLTFTSFELIGTQNDTINRQIATILNYGLAYLLAILLALNLSGAHLNPAYTFASAAYGYLKWGRAFNYLTAQYIGSFLAAIFVHATYSDKLVQRHSEGLLIGMNVTLRAHGNILSTGKFFSSYPPTEVSLSQLFISYTLATIHLMLMLLLIQESKLIKMPRCLRPIYMAAALILIQAAFSANGGPVLNPAQDFSPRLYIAMFGWGSAAFNLYRYNYWWLCGIVAPHLGALIGFGLYQIPVHLKTIKDSSSRNNINGTDEDDDEDEDDDDDDYENEVNLGDDDDEDDSNDNGFIGGRNRKRRESSVSRRRRRGSDFGRARNRDYSRHTQAQPVGSGF